MKEGINLQFIAKINKNLFNAISINILTDEVALTEKQREHIEVRHPNILQKFEKHFKEIIENPDYIMKDNTRENITLIFKTIQAKNKNENIICTVNLVLKLAVSGEDETNKNSIITCIPVGKSRLKTYIKNGKIIYKRE